MVIQYGLRTDIASEPSSSDSLSYQRKRWRLELHTSMQYSTTIIPSTPVCKKGKQYEEVVTMEVCMHACSRRVGSNDENSIKCASKSLARLSTFDCKKECNVACVDESTPTSTGRNRNITASGTKANYRCVLVAASWAILPETHAATRAIGVVRDTATRCFGGRTL